MRKLIGVLVALCILTVFVSSASACYPWDPNCKTDGVKVPTIKVPYVPTVPTTGTVSITGAYATQGESGAIGECDAASQTVTTIGVSDGVVTSGTVTAASGEYVFASTNGGTIGTIYYFNP